jgi:hypothetical protein
METSPSQYALHPKMVVLHGALNCQERLLIVKAVASLHTLSVQKMETSIADKPVVMEVVIQCTKLMMGH